MLPRHQRLRRNGEFHRVYRRGRACSLPALTIHVLAGGAGKRMGVCVSRKLGGAVARNRLRRQLREILRGAARRWRDGFDAVLVARPAAGAATFQELAAAVDQLALRARLIPEGGATRDTRSAEKTA